MKKCYFCKGDILTKKKTKVDLWWGEKLLVFEGVPVELCSQCGEKYFSAGISKQLLRKAKSVEKKNVKEMMSVPLISFAKA